MIRQIAHTCFKTDNPKELVDFYVNKLGLKQKFTFKDDQKNDFGFYIDAGNSTFIEIFDQKGAAKKWGGKAKELKPNDGTMYQHLCLEVAGIEDYRKMLLRNKVNVGEISTGMDNSRQMWIQDPDGNKIELMEYTHASLQVQ